MPDTCFVFFRSGETTLAEAADALVEQGLEVTRQVDCLEVRDSESPTYKIHWVRGSHVVQEAVEISEQTEYRESMKHCDERFEIQIESLEEALDEMNTLMEVQGTLQDISAGYLYLPWNGNLLEPWKQ